MKKVLISILLLAVLFINNEGCHAQFLKKLAKGIENASKQVDKVLGTEEIINTGNAEINGSKITVTTPHRNLQVNILGAEMSGDNYILEFTITNRGENIKDYRLTGCFGGCGNTKAYDNLGNECRVDIVFSTSESWHGGTAGSSLLNDTPAKVKVILSRFSSKATSFSQIRIKGEAWDHGYTNRPNGDFVFKNIPIIKNEEVEVAIPAKKNVPVSNNISSTTIDIPKLTINGEYGNTADLKRINDDERALFKIDEIQSQCGTFNNKCPNNLLSVNRRLFQGEKPMMITLLFINDRPDNGIITSEYLVSYDKQGNFSDCIVVAEKWPSQFSKAQWDSTIEGNKVQVHVVDDENDYESWNSYRITPDFKFNLMQ